MRAAMNHELARLETAIMKPLLRGWIHAGAALGAVLVTIVLCWLSLEDTTKMGSMLIFGLTTIELYVVSSLYHIGNWGRKTHRVLRTVDHSNIYLVIAGTYTPICINVLEGPLRIFSLAAVWLMAIGGVALPLLTVGLPRSRVVTSRKLRVTLYIGMGWISIIALPTLIEALGWTPVGLLALGGVFYTIGAIIYAMGRPNPF